MKDKAVFDYNLKLTQKYCGLKESSKMGDVCSQLRTINSVIKGEQIFEFKLINYYKFGEILEVDWIVDPLYKSNRVKEIYEIQINKKEETLLKGDSFLKEKCWSRSIQILYLKVLVKQHPKDL